MTQLLFLAGLLFLVSCCFFMKSYTDLLNGEIEPVVKELSQYFVAFERYSTFLENFSNKIANTFFRVLETSNWFERQLLTIVGLLTSFPMIYDD